ncbi:hypothetical protein, partial [Microbacterium sp.]|uniref:hypothetical protein n=1 Tax=Microbacterium sp. TaxID=51671 RepID=UPI003221C23E
GMTTPSRPDHSRSTAEAIASLFVVPDALVEAVAAVTEKEARDRMRRRGVVVDAKATAHELATRLTRDELGDLSDAELEPDQVVRMKVRRGELLRELMLQGTPDAYAVFRARLDIAKERARVKTARAAIEATQRRAHTDPVTGRFDLRVHGTVDTRSIVPARAGEPGADWHHLRSSALVHHLASVQFALRALERDPELAAAVEAEVQRMLDEAGL